MKVFDFLYYRLYRAFLKTTAKDVAEYVACLWLAGLLAINVIVITKKTGFKPLEIMPPKVWSVLFIVPMFILFYFLFLRGKRYLQIIDRYKDETKQQRMRGNLILIAYVVVTFAALLLL